MLYLHTHILSMVQIQNQLHIVSIFVQVVVVETVVQCNCSLLWPVVVVRVCDVRACVLLVVISTINTSEYVSYPIRTHFL
jgi:hypothetical protein